MELSALDICVVARLGDLVRSRGAPVDTSRVIFVQSSCKSPKTPKNLRQSPVSPSWAQLSGWRTFLNFLDTFPVQGQRARP